MQVLYFFEYKPPSQCQSPSVTPIKVTRVTSRSEPLFQSVRVRLRFASTSIIRFSSSSLLAILKNTVRFDKISVKPFYKTPVRLSGLRIWKNFYFRDALLNINIVCCASFLKSKIIQRNFFFLLAKEIDIAAKNLKLNYFLAFCSKNCSVSVTLC